MNWLLRYARHCGVVLEHPMGASHALRAKFQPSGWRLLYRSGRAPFLPILRNRRLGFGDLQQYVAVLVSTGWAAPPPSRLVQHLIDQSYLYFEEKPDAPSKTRDMQLLRIAVRSEHVSRKSFAEVLLWVVREKPRLEHRRSWARLVSDAKAWRASQAVELAAAYHEPWEFAVNRLELEGYEFVALRTPWDLWEEGVAMFNCVYKLRRICLAPRPSRFFSMRRLGVRIATVELRLLSDGRTWMVLDCRLSFNRLPSAAISLLADVLAISYAIAEDPSRRRIDSRFEV